MEMEPRIFFMKMIPFSFLVLISHRGIQAQEAERKQAQEKVWGIP